MVPKRSPEAMAPGSVGNEAGPGTHTYNDDRTRSSEASIALS